jgi:cytochrome c oxidase assembly protein subunit 15
MGGNQPPRWPGRVVHIFAVLTALLALPLLFFGAQVSTMKVGMVDPVWPTVPWFLWKAEAWVRGIGFQVEHAHRLFGYTVGTSGIVLLLSTLWLERRRYVRWLAVIGFIGICVQGVLGGLRVDLISTELALVHGCFGQLVFAVLVSVALATSRRWTADDHSFAPEETALLRRASLALTGLLVLQLIMGALIRHEDSAIGQRLHLLNAFAVVAGLCWLVNVIRNSRFVAAPMSRAVILLVGLTVVQLMLGVEAWIVKFAAHAATNPDHWLFNRDLVRTLHVLAGSLILATSVVVTLEAHRRTAWKAAAVVQGPVGHLEEIA